MYTESSATSLIFKYSKSGFTQIAKFAGRVHGVVVQATKLTEGSFTIGKEIIIAGS